MGAESNVLEYHMCSARLCWIDHDSPLKLQGYQSTAAEGCDAFEMIPTGMQLIAGSREFLGNPDPDAVVTDNWAMTHESATLLI